MSPVQSFFLVFATLAGIILYVATIVLPEPPLWVSLTSREPVRVVTSSVEMRRHSKMPARPQIEVRDAQGDLSQLQGYPWMGSRRASDIVDKRPRGGVMDVSRWKAKLWVSLVSFGDWILLAVGALAALFMVFAVGMALKLRHR